MLPLDFNSNHNEPVKPTLVPLTAKLVEKPAGSATPTLVPLTAKLVEKPAGSATPNSVPLTAKLVEKPAGSATPTLVPLTAKLVEKPAGSATPNPVPLTAKLVEKPAESATPTLVPLTAKLVEKPAESATPTPVPLTAKLVEKPAGSATPAPVPLVAKSTPKDPEQLLTQIFGNRTQMDPAPKKVLSQIFGKTSSENTGKNNTILGQAESFKSSNSWEKTPKSPVGNNITESKSKDVFTDYKNSTRNEPDNKPAISNNILTPNVNIEPSRQYIKINVPVSEIGVGEFLKRCRDLTNYSIETVEQKTKIKKNFIIAMENEEKNTLPPPVFVLAYINNLCDLYNVTKQQKEELLNYYKGLQKEEDVEESDIIKTPARALTSTSQAGNAILRRGNLQESLQEGHSEKIKSSTLMVVAGILLFIGIVSVILIWQSQNTHEFDELYIAEIPEGATFTMDHFSTLYNTQPMLPVSEIPVP